jgi:hypothetical protein
VGPWQESGLPMGFARGLGRIRSPLLCPLSYGRIRLCVAETQHRNQAQNHGVSSTSAVVSSEVVVDVLKTLPTVGGIVAHAQPRSWDVMVGAPPNKSSILRRGTRWYLRAIFAAPVARLPPRPKLPRWSAAQRRSCLEPVHISALVGTPVARRFAPLRLQPSSPRFFLGLLSP